MARPFIVSLRMGVLDGIASGVVLVHMVLVQSTEGIPYLKLAYDSCRVSDQ